MFVLRRRQRGLRQGSWVFGLSSLLGLSSLFLFPFLISVTQLCPRLRMSDAPGTSGCFVAEVGSSVDSMI